MMDGKRISMNVVLPAIALAGAYGISACGSDPAPGSQPVQNCPELTTSTTTAGGGGDGGEGVAVSSSTTGAGGDTSGSSAGETAGNEDTTFDHMNNNPFDILAQHAEEGPDNVRTRLHSCGKIRYKSLGNFLESRGVDLDATSGTNIPTAGELYTAGADALGAAQYAAGRAEEPFASTAAMTKLLDIYVQAAPEVIANLSGTAACAGATPFQTDGDCNYEAFSCIMGRPMTAEDMTLCNLVAHDDSPNAQPITVAVFLAAGNTCE